MKPANKINISSKQVAEVLTGIMVFAGIITFSLMNKTQTDGDLMARIFLVLFGLIITVQNIPGLMQFGAMPKGAYNLSHKHEVPK